MLASTLVHNYFTVLNSDDLLESYNQSAFYEAVYGLSEAVNKWTKLHEINKQPSTYSRLITIPSTKQTPSDVERKLGLASTTKATYEAIANTGAKNDM